MIYIRYFIISDTHWGHFNIIRYCNRPFKTLEEMDKKLIENWNSRVKEDDLVFELGDFNFRNSAGGKPGEGVITRAKDYEKQLNGHIIHLKGNHSRNNGIKTCIEKIIISYGGYKMCMVHNPLHADSNYPINLVGHVHTAWLIRRLNSRSIMYNTGVDLNGFKPITFEEIFKKIHQFQKDEKLKKVVPVETKNDNKTTQ